MHKGFAALLASSVVAMTSWASGCDLSCSLERIHSVCGLGWTAASEPMSPQMDMSSMDMPEHSLTAQPESNGLAHLHANSCTHSPCNEISISATWKSAPQPAPALALTGFERPLVSAIPGQVRWNIPEQKPPDLQPFDPLAVSLRI
jgi:hypothetical protein